MKRLLIVIIIFIPGLLFLTRSTPVILRIPKDATIRPAYYCLLNPFRDRGPETVAARYLSQLRDGHVESVACCIGDRKYILEREREWPIQSWRIGNRTDSDGRSEIGYWVTRGNGYSHRYGEEEVHVWLIRSVNGWELQSFSAVY
jgi:hypothetical protein